MGPGLALLLFFAGLGLLWLLLRPGAGWLHRAIHLFRMSERVRMEDTLKHLLRCESMGLPSTTESVAGALGIPPGRALALMVRLDRRDLARSDASGHHLTREGRSYALRLVRAHRLLERYFADRTGMPEQEWHAEAERAEHRLTRDETERLAARMGHPLYDPHGDPIPGPTGELPPQVGIPLTSVDDGSVVRIVHLEDEPREVYDRLVARGLALGMTLRVDAVEPSMVRFTAEGREDVLEAVLAANVEVVAADSELSGSTGPEGTWDTLADLHLGASATVIGIAPTLRGPQRRRMLDLGMVPGTTITAVLTSAAGDPVAYEIRGAQIALRREQAAAVRVRLLTGHGEVAA